MSAISVEQGEGGDLPQTDCLLQRQSKSRTSESCPCNHTYTKIRERTSRIKRRQMGLGIKDQGSKDGWLGKIKHQHTWLQS